MGLVLISHDLGVIGRLCDDVVVMYAGEAVEQGTAAAIFDAPAHPYTRALFGALPQAQRQAGSRLYAIPGVVPAPTGLPPGCKFANRCDFAIDQCRAAPPPLLATDTDHFSRCIRAAEFGV